MAIFLVLGTVGRDPWKADEPYCIGIVQNILQTGDWLIPHVAATPFLEKPPLVYWSAALAAALFSGALPFADAARLAVLGWMALTLVAVSWAARSMYDGERGWLTILLTLGTVGVWQHSHKLVPDVSQLAGATLALAALVRFVSARTSPVRAGLLAGTGIGIAFLSKGLLIPGVYAVLAALFPLYRRDFRTRAWLATVSWAAFAALPWLIVWPGLLYYSAPDLFVTWLWDNNVDRFLGIHHHGEGHPNRGLDILTLAGLTFPTGVLAGLALWRRYRHHGDAGGRWPATTVAVALFALTMVVTLELSASLREVYFLPIYPALALLAAGLEWSPIWAARLSRALLWAAGSILALVAAIWALLLAGQGQRLPTSIGRWLPLDYVLPFQWPWFMVAVIVVATCLMALRWRALLGPVAAWFVSVTLPWGLVHTLLLPWLDIAKSYRQPFQELARALPADTRCLASIALGESEIAMLQYFTGLTVYDLRAMPRSAQCSVVVVMVEGRHPAPTTVSKVFWSGSRLGDRYRRFIAYDPRPSAERDDCRLPAPVE